MVLRTKSSCVPYYLIEYQSYDNRCDCHGSDYTKDFFRCRKTDTIEVKGVNFSRQEIEVICLVHR